MGPLKYFLKKLIESCKNNLELLSSIGKTYLEYINKLLTPYSDSLIYYIKITFEFTYISWKLFIRFLVHSENCCKQFCLWLRESIIDLILNSPYILLWIYTRIMLTPWRLFHNYKKFCGWIGWRVIDLICGAKGSLLERIMYDLCFKVNQVYWSIVNPINYLNDRVNDTLKRAAKHMYPIDSPLYDPMVYRMFEDAVIIYGKLGLAIVALYSVVIVLKWYYDLD